MKNFHVVNYHITNRCNYQCAYCFGKFNRQKNPTLADAKKVVESIASYFAENNITDGRINFAGGEPTLYAYFDKLIAYTSSLGIRVSIVTNGSMLTSERIRNWQGKVSCIGISIDSIDRDTNLTIGRCCINNVISPAQWRKLAKTVHGCGIALKINTVVSRLNLDQDLSKLYRELSPDKIKLFQMHLIDGINDQAKAYEIAESEFESFCERHKAFQSVIVTEPYGSMENSYLMVNPEGKIQLNDNGSYKTFGDLKTHPLSEILKNVPMNSEKFGSRYKKENVK